MHHKLSLCVSASFMLEGDWDKEDLGIRKEKYVGFFLKFKLLKIGEKKEEKTIGMYE